MSVDYESLASRLANLPRAERLEILAELDAETLERLQWDWRVWARSNQIEPDGDWRTWLILAGRGWGKTRTGAEWLTDKVQRGIYRRVHLVGATAADIRDTMVEGESGLVTISPPWFRAKWRPTKRRVEWPNGAIGLAFSADEPERLRGPQCEAAWADELASWRYPEAWIQLMLGMRLGGHPRAVVTTTPKPTELIKRLVKAETTHLTKGTTYENVENLAEAFSEEIIQVYEGTRFGRQELYAEILDDAPGALWHRENLDEYRIAKSDVPPLDRVVIGIDPAVSFSERAGETGMIVAGLGRDGHGYVLSDLSAKMKPEQWASKAIKSYYSEMADRIVPEANQGGDMVENTIRAIDPNVSVRSVRASRAKVIRAEPVAALYEQGKVHHVGYFEKLEDQLCSWEQGDASPDRLDALVWALTDLMVMNRRLHLVSWSNDAELTTSKSGWKL
jgi:phage terminase large subunit-like protein